MRALAIDQGTTSTRAFLVDSAKTGEGQIVCRREHRQFYPHSGQVEHDPQELLRHVRDCLQEAGPVDVIGLGNQGESCLAWDRVSGEPVSPVIVWQDQRTAEQVLRLKDGGAEVLTMARAGLPLDAYFSASKLAWILENNPRAQELHRQGRLCLGTTDAFFLNQLTGRFVTDITTASRTSLMDLQTGRWDAELCALFGVPMECLPEICPTMGHFGDVQSGGHAVPLMASVVDQQAALYGHGCTQAGDVKITFGTGAFALALTGPDLRRPEQGRLLPTVAWQHVNTPAVYALDGGVYCAASAINWGRSLGLFSEFGQINAFATPAAITRDLAFVPALAGLGSPFWDRTAAGMWIGLSLDTTPADMMQAMLEGIALRTAQVMDAMAEEIPLRPMLSIDGGLSANDYFCQFLADVLERHVHVQANPELTALGMASMALKACGEDLKRPREGKSYRPQAHREAARTRFADAVKRSRNWTNMP